MSEISFGVNGIVKQSIFEKNITHNHLGCIVYFEEDENGMYVFTEDVYPKMIENIPSK